LVIAVMNQAIRRLASSIAIALVGAACAIGAILELGSQAAESIAADPRYTQDVLDIDCNAPPGQERVTFLQEVHYYGRLPERLNVLESDLEAQLLKAFEEHPRVAQVARLSVVGRRIRVELIFRP
jgi:hypothetical protein